MREVQPPHAFIAKLHEPLGQPDRGVHDRPPDETDPLQQDQRNPNRVDGRENHIGRVGNSQGRQNRREVAAVAAETIEHPAGQAADHPRPDGRSRRLEVVADPSSARHDLVEAEQSIPLERAGPQSERRPPLRSVAIGVEDAWGSIACHRQHGREPDR